MNQLEELKKKMNEILEENKPQVILNSKEDKVIRDFEVGLIENEIKVEFSMNVAEIRTDLAEKQFGTSGFKRENYLLSWRKWEGDNFRLVLTNIPHNNSKLILKSPEIFKKDIVEILDEFARNFKDNLDN